MGNYANAVIARIRRIVFKRNFQKTIRRRAAIAKNRDARRNIVNTLFEERGARMNAIALSAAIKLLKKIQSIFTLKGNLYKNWILTA